MSKIRIHIFYTCKLLLLTARCARGYALVLIILQIGIRSILELVYAILQIE